jgi:hypothetical protein
MMETTPLPKFFDPALALLFRAVLESEPEPEQTEVD